jgi:hypothetical protein
MLLVPAAFMLGLRWYKTAALLLFLFVLRRAVVGLLYDNLLPELIGLDPSRRGASRGRSRPQARA